MLDNDEYYYEQSLFSISNKKDDSIYSLEFILGILNSSLSKYLLKINPFSNKDLFPQIRLHWLKEYPIRLINNDDTNLKYLHDKIVTLVDQMLESKKQLQLIKTDKDKTYYERKCKTLDKQIDSEVYKLYGLTEEEIKIVENKN